jgi:diacylglycerol kinase family enzyme
MHLSLVINRSAGSFRKLPMEPTVAAIADIFRAAGHRVDVAMCGHRDLSMTLSSLADRPDIDAVVIGGGDGTILTAILAGLGKQRPIGLLPLGTMNLLCRDLGLAHDPLEAARQLAIGETAAIDLAEVNGVPFAIWASLGMHPWMVRRRDHLQRDGMHKWPAMALAALRALRRYPIIRAGVTIGAETTTIATPVLVVTNNPWSDGTLPFRRLALSGDLLEVHVARCSSRLSLLWLAFNALIGHWRIARLLVSYRADTIRVVSRHRRVIVSLDGEVTVMHLPLIFRKRPKALNVLVPSLDRTAS